jgi:hypothetical protein
MARALQDILTELNAVYQPQKDIYNTQLGSLDPQLQAETQGLEAQKRDSFQQITDQANRRGLFYSGLPVAEEQRYTGQQFLPAVANLRAKYSSQRFGLQDAIAKITADQYNQGQGIYQKELDRDAEMKMFNDKLAADAANARASASGGGGFSPGGAFGAAGAAGGAGAQDYTNSAREDAIALRNEFLTNGSTTFSREQARDALRAKYDGILSDEQILNLIYKEVFPDDWAGRNGQVAQPGQGNEVIYSPRY